MQSFKLLVRTIVFTLTFLVAGQAHSALLAFTDRTAWQAAAGGSGDLSENFNSVAQDIFYGPAPVTQGFLTLEVVNGTYDSSWRIDAQPDAFTSIPNVDGTTFATVLGLDYSSFGDTLMSFQDVNALGFDYSGGTYSNTNTRLTTSRGDTVDVPQQTTGTFFLGLLYTGGENFSSLLWGPDGCNNCYVGMGIDNLEAFTSLNPVPVPAAFWLFGTALIGLIGFGKRRKVA
jgi:hypothetical protein